MTREQRELVERVIASLERRPWEWVFDRYSGDHQSGVSVWIANSHYGMSIQYGGGKVVGGVTGWSSLFGPLIPWRSRLRRAALAAADELNPPPPPVPTAADALAVFAAA